jgi:hypothetical protein
MKATLFCLLNFFICFFSNAQPYHSFIHDTAVWNETDFTYCCDPQYNAYFGYQLKYVMLGDTVINALQYKKVFRQVNNIVANNIFGCYPWFGNYYELEISGFIREDSSKKVYFLGHSSDPPVPDCAPVMADTEIILYDFNLQVGDNVQWKPFNNIVFAIDSVQAPNGEFLKRIMFDGQQDFWIEGLGSTFAFFGPYLPPPFECGCVLDCAQASDLLAIGSPPPCGGIATAVTQPDSEKELQIFPNPYSDFVHLLLLFNLDLFYS